MVERDSVIQALNGKDGIIVKSDRVIIGNRIYLNYENIDAWTTEITRKEAVEKYWKVLKKEAKKTGKLSSIPNPSIWDIPSKIRMIKIIDNGLARFNGHSFGMFDPMNSSYNNPKTLLFLELPKYEYLNTDIVINKGNLGVLKMYIVRKEKNSDKLRDVTIRLFQMSVPNKHEIKTFKGISHHQGKSSISYLHNDLLFRILDFGEIPKPIMNVIHAND